MPANTGWTGEIAGSDYMAAEAQSEVHVAAASKPRRRGDWEFLWRFIAVAMLFEIVWAVWIAIQINPPPIALPAAFAAAAKARANRNVEAQIMSPDRAPAALTAPRGPLVNVEKLRLSESIETAVPERPAESAK